MLDRDGFRPNVGIILLNQRNQVFWGKRIRTHSWQFPQGGIDRGESPEQAMFRELHEEVGLHAGACAHRRPYPRLVALRGAGSITSAATRAATTRARSRSGSCCKLIGPRLGPEPARHRPSRVRRLALERLLGAAGRGGRVQARRLRDGADRAGALPAARRLPQPLPAQRHARAARAWPTQPAPSAHVPPAASCLPAPAAAGRRPGRWRRPPCRRARGAGQARDASAAQRSAEHQVVPVHHLRLGRVAEQRLDLADGLRASGAPRRVE